MATLDDLNALLSSLPGYSILTDGMKNAALAGALVPDVNGVWPGQPDYINTYDIYYAAYNLIGFLKAQPVVTGSSSEGTSVTVQAPDWSALLAYYKGQSQVLGYARDVLTPVPIPDLPHVSRVNMRGEGSYGAGIDTSLG